MVDPDNLLTEIVVRDQMNQVASTTACMTPQVRPSAFMESGKSRDQHYYDC